MDLASLLKDATAIAFSIAKDAVEEVEWTFTTSDEVSFDPAQDTLTGVTATETIPILPYTDQSNDTGGSFSSTGRFVDAAIERNEISFMMEADKTKGYVPTVNDFFMRGSLKYIVRVMDLIPTDPIYMGKASRG